MRLWRVVLTCSAFSISALASGQPAARPDVQDAQAAADETTVKAE